GMADIQNKILRTIGDPVARFTEDGLRPIRGCRIAAKNAFTIEEKTRLAMFACRHVTAKVAPERFYDEWRKTLHLKDKAAFWQNILNAGIVGAFLPTIESFFSAERSGIFLREINLIQPRTMAAYAASIFYLLRITDNSLQKTTLLNTKFPTAQLKLALSLLASPLLIIDATTSRLEFKKNLMRITKLERVHHVRFAIAMRLAAMREEGAIPQAQKDFETHVRALYREIRKSREAIDMGALFINGVDIQSLGVTGRNVGVVLQHLLNKVIETPALNNRDRLLEEARHFSKSL
ncbi:MAG TPA: hypothetical protein PLY93_06570, partial [Turneriella sp.]|nr:hypothetical protein [Turneriella sp.]